MDACNAGVIHTGRSFRKRAPAARYPSRHRPPSARPEVQDLAESAGTIAIHAVVEHKLILDVAITLHLDRDPCALYTSRAL